jgi:hypothetical protein
VPTNVTILGPCGVYRMGAPVWMSSRPIQPQCRPDFTLSTLSNNIPKRFELPSRMLKKVSSVVLASLRGSTYGAEYASPLWIAARLVHVRSQSVSMDRTGSAARCDCPADAPLSSQGALRCSRWPALPSAILSGQERPRVRQCQCLPPVLACVPAQPVSSHADPHCRQPLHPCRALRRHERLSCPVQAAGPGAMSVAGRAVRGQFQGPGPNHIPGCRMRDIVLRCDLACLVLRLLDGLAGLAADLDSKADAHLLVRIRELFSREDSCRGQRSQPGRPHRHDRWTVAGFRTMGGTSAGTPQRPV